MSTSKLLKEDEEFLYLRKYLHGDSDEYADWQCSSEGCPDPKWSEDILVADSYVGYEVELNYRIRKSDAEVFIDEIK